MSFNDLFGNQSHTHHKILKDPTQSNLGVKLNKVRDRRHATQEIPLFDIGNSVSFTPVSAYGASLLDSTSLADLRAQILENTNEEAIRLLADGNNEINFYTGGTGASNLKLQVKNSSVDLVNNIPLNVNDLNVGLNKSLIADYVGSRADENLRLRRGAAVYQEFIATGINMNENVVYADNKHLKQKIEDSDSRVFLESVAKRQYCLYSYEAGSNSGLLIQADGDVIKLNNYKNTAASYQPISVNSTALSYFVCGSVSNPTTINTANFVSNGVSLFCNGSNPILDIRSTSIKPYVSIIPNGVNAEDLGSAANYFGNLHVNSINLKNDIFIDFFNSVDIKNDGFYFRSGFGSGSGIQDNMSIRGHNNSGANDGIAISAYGGVSINCGAISATNDNGTDAATNRVMLLGVTINNHRNMLPYIDGGTDLGSVSNKFNEIYGNNIRAHTSLYTDSIRPYSSSPVHFHNTSITTDNGYSLAVDRVQSTATGRDLLIGNDTSTKLAIKGGATGNVELVAPSLVPPVDTTNSIGTGAFRFGSVNGMIVSAWTKVNTELIQHLGSGVIELDGVTRPYTNGNINLGDATKRWAEVFANNGTINTSDRNAKRDIQPIKNALQFVRKLKPVMYKWKENSHGRTHTGFIAQEVLEANPLGLRDNWSGYVDTGNGLALRYSEFISVNTQAIKELDEKFKVLAIRVNNSDGEAPVKVDLNYHTDSDEIIERLEILENRELAPVVEEYDDSEMKEEMKQLKIEIIDLKIENKKQEDCISQLIADNMNLSKKLEMLMEKFEKFDETPNVGMKIEDNSDMILSDTGDLDMMENVQERLHNVEQKITKLSNKQAKLVTAVNKLKK